MALNRRKLLALAAAVLGVILVAASVAVINPAGLLALAGCVLLVVGLRIEVD